MANPLTEALTASISASIDPMNGMTRDYVRGLIDRQDQELIALKAKTVKELQELKAKAVDSGADPAVIGAYDRLLGQASAA